LVRAARCFIDDTAGANLMDMHAKLSPACRAEAKASRSGWWWWITSS